MARLTLAQRVAKLEKALRPAAKPASRRFKSGDEVVYKASWEGMVIPTPPWARAEGLQGPLVYVVRNTDNAVRGCYPVNLTPASEEIPF